MVNKALTCQFHEDLNYVAVLQFPASTSTKRKRHEVQAAVEKDALPFLW